MGEKKDNTKIFSILSYIGILWLIGLLCDKDNEVVKFHVNEGIWLTIIGAVISAVSCGVLSIVVLIFAIIGIVNAVNDKQVHLPLFDKLPAILK